MLAIVEGRRVRALVLVMEPDLTVVSSGDGVAEGVECYLARVFGADRRPNALTLFGIGGSDFNAA